MNNTTGFISTKPHFSIKKHSTFLIALLALPVVAAPYEEDEPEYPTIIPTVKINVPAGTYKLVDGTDTRYGLFVGEDNKSKTELRNQGHTNQAMEWVIKDHPNPGLCPAGGKVIKSNFNGQHLARELDRATLTYSPVLKDESDFGDGYNACWHIHRFLTRSNELGNVAIFTNEGSDYARQYLADRDGKTVLVNASDSHFDTDSTDWEIFKAGHVVKHNTRATIEASSDGGRVITAGSDSKAVLINKIEGASYQSFFLRPHDNGTFVFETVKPKSALVVPNGEKVETYDKLGYVGDDGHWFIDQKIDGRYVISNLGHPGVMTDSQSIHINLNGYNNSNDKQEWHIWQ